jgi:hypothetical protein
MNRLLTSLIAGLAAVALTAGNSPAAPGHQHTPSGHPQHQPAQHQPAHQPSVTPQHEPAHKPDVKPHVKPSPPGHKPGPKKPGVKPGHKPGKPLVRPRVRVVVRERLVIRAPHRFGVEGEVNDDGLLAVKFLRLENRTAASLTAYVLLPDEEEAHAFTLAPGEYAYVSVDDEPVALAQAWLWAEAASGSWTKYKDDALVLVEAPYRADEVATYTYSFKD